MIEDAYHYLHLLKIWEVSWRNVVFFLNLLIDGTQVGNQFLLFVVFAKHAGHLFL